MLTSRSSWRDVRAWKGALVDLVSACMIHEPNYSSETVTNPSDNINSSASNSRPDGSCCHEDHKRTTTTSKAHTAHTPTELPLPLSTANREGAPLSMSSATSDGAESHPHHAQRHGQRQQQQRQSVTPPSARPTSTVELIRQLAHAISREDGEFVLKLALHVRHQLNIRRTANFLAALCAREERCVPYLTCYLERIIVLPSDWLAIANFAFFFDREELHTRYDAPELSPPACSVSQARSSGSGHRYAAVPSGAAKHSRRFPSSQPQQAAPRLPNALRRALVVVFSRFDIFSLAKYNNEKAEKRFRAKAKRAAARASDSDSLDSSTSSATGTSSHTEHPPRASPQQRRTFTYKQLVRLLHIRTPAYAVCCLLGKRYPSTAAEFHAMGLHEDGRHTFDPSRAGTRMRLPMPETWETRLARDGNRGSTWDALVELNSLPFMAMLRNLRNILTRRCSPATHTKLLARLRSAEQVAASRQFPYRFLSAYTMLQQALEDRAVMEQWLQQRRRNRALPFPRATETNGVRPHRCELPLPKESALKKLVEQYAAACDCAVALSTTVNVLPMKGTSIVILCLWETMLEQVKAVGGGPIGSLRTKLEVATLLAVMMIHACEQCSVLLFCFDEYLVLDAQEIRQNGILPAVESIVRTCKTMLDRHSGRCASAEEGCRPGSGAVFPYAYLDQVIEQRVLLQTLVVIDEGHHTYSSMNMNAPTLGDLPVYIGRMRRTGSAEVIFIGLSVSSSATALPEAHDEIGAVGTAYATITNPRLRYTHHNDILLTGFSDSVLRLVAERQAGGPLATIERADELYNVNRTSAHMDRLVNAERRKAMRTIMAFERQREKHHSTTSHQNESGGLTVSEPASLSTARDGASPLTPDARQGISQPEGAQHGHHTFATATAQSLEDAVRGAAATDGEHPHLFTAAIPPLEPRSASASASSPAPSQPALTRPEVYHPTPFISVSQVSGGRAGAMHLRYAMRASAAAQVPVFRDADLVVSPSSPLSPVSPSAGRRPPASLRDTAKGAGATTSSSRESAADNSRHVLERASAAVAAGVPRPLQSYRECRFFLSSTFLDMNNERNALTLDVFPQVRRWAAEHGLKVTLLEVDLRWGITEAASVENLSTSVCLNEVSRCAPFFIGMLGSRYGSCPSPIHIVADEDVALPDYAWLETLPPEADGRISVTELEMRHGIYNARRRLCPREPSSVVFFHRDDEYLQRSLPQDARRDVYAPDTATTPERIARLVQYVRGQQVPVISYKASFVHGHRDGDGAPTTSSPEVALPSSSDTLKDEDQLGRWATRGAASMTRPFFATADDGASALPGATIPGPATLSSRDVLLDMREFTHKAFVALKTIISQVCGVPLATSDTPEPADAGAAAAAAAATTPKVLPPQDQRDARGRLVSPAAARVRPNESTSRHPDVYTARYFDLHNYMKDLCKLYVAPHGLIKELVRFALTGSLAWPAERAAAQMSAPVVDSKEYGEGGRASENTSVTEASTMSSRYSVDDTDSRSNVLVVESGDGNGKSSALAALAAHLFEIAVSTTSVIYYSLQAGDTSARSLVFFLAVSLVMRTGLTNEFHICESESLSNILQLLPQIYAAIKRRKASVVVIIDALERSFEADELLHNMGFIVNPAAAPEVRFILASSKLSPFTIALRSRVPPARVLPLPQLSYHERAALVRRHLAFYGKRLQETMPLNELSGLLRKQQACYASYLTSAIMYLRLFSTFDTLRKDMRTLPGTMAQLYTQLFRVLEQRFDANTCRLVFIVLYLRRDAGGIMEYNLYRLVSNVAAASRLVALLSGTCILSTRGRVYICSTFFEASIATTYLPHEGDRIHAYEMALTAELLYQPLSINRSPAEVRATLRAVTDSLEQSARDPSLPCVFRPARYAPRELFGILQSAVQARQPAVMIALVSYLPFIESLLNDRSMLQRLISLLSQARASNAPVVRRVDPLLMFFQKQYHILSQRPDLLRQCVLNTPTSFNAISRFSSEYMERLAAGRQRRQLALGSGDDGAAAAHHATRRPCGAESAVLASAEGRGAAAGDAERNMLVRWLNLAQHGGEQRLAVYHPSSRRPILCMDISSNTRYVALGCDDCYARVVSVAEVEKVTASLKHTAAVTAVAFLRSRDNILFSGCARGAFHVWSLEDNSLLQLGAAHLRCISCIACHPSEALVCTGSHDSFCMLWDVLGGTSSVAATLAAAHQTQRSCSSTSRPRPLGAALRKFTLTQLDGKHSNLQPFDVLRHHSTPVASVAFHSAGEVLATGAWDGSVFLINLHAMREPQQRGSAAALARGVAGAAPEHQPDILAYASLRFNVAAPVRVVSFAPSLVVTCAVGSYDGLITLVDFASGQESAKLRSLHAAPLSAIAFSPDGKLMASADEHGILRVTYAGVTGTLFCSLNGHREAITAIRFLEGKVTQLISASVDASVQLWALNTNERVDMPTSHAAAVTAIVVATDGSFFVTGAADGTAFVFTQAEQEEAPRYRRRPPAAGGGDDDDSSSACMQPSFSLTHNGRRISCLQVGLSNTRILAGVAFGDVYVWAATPGLNRREGRLLQRVRVPAHGLYPVVSIECHELQPLVRDLERHPSSSSSETGSPEQTDAPRTSAFNVFEALDGGPPNLSSAQATGAGWPPRTPASPTARSASHARATVASVTALCSNSETARFLIFQDSVSMALQLPPNTATTMPLATHHPPMAPIASHEAPEDANCPLMRRRSSLEGAADSCTSSHDPTEESHSPVARQRLSWFAPRHGYTPTCGISAAAVENVLTTQPPSPAHRRFAPHDSPDHQAMSPSSRTGSSRHHRDKPSDLLRPTSVSWPTAAAASPGEWDEVLGEEVLAAIPLRFRQHLPLPSQSHLRRQSTTELERDINSASGSHSSLATAVHSDMDAHQTQSPLTRLLEEDLHYSLLIGQQRFFVASYRDHAVAPVAVLKDRTLALQQDVFETDFALAADVVFTCASEPVRLPQLGNGSDESREDIFFAVATSQGQVLLFRLTHCPLPEASHTFQDMRGACPSPSTGGGRLHALRDRFCLVLWHAFFIRERQDVSECLRVHTLGMSIVSAAANRCTAVATPLTGHHQDSSNHPLRLHLLVGCSNGCIRLFTCQGLPHITPLAQGTAPAAARPKALTTEAASHAPKLPVADAQPSRGAETSVRAAGAADLHGDLFIEEGTFFGTAAATALIVFPACETVPRRGPQRSYHHARPAVDRQRTRYPADRLDGATCGLPVPLPMDGEVQWVSGDNLGNVYQLRMEDEAVEENLWMQQSRSTRSLDFRTLRGCNPSSCALQQLLACTGDARGAMPQRTTRESADLYALRSRGWAWNSAKPFDWLRAVDLSRPLAAELSTREVGVPTGAAASVGADETCSSNSVQTDPNTRADLFASLAKPVRQDMNVRGASTVSTLKTAPTRGEPNDAQRDMQIQLPDVKSYLAAAASDADDADRWTVDGGFIVPATSYREAAELADEKHTTRYVVSPPRLPSFAISSTTSNRHNSPDGRPTPPSLRHMSAVQHGAADVSSGARVVPVNTDCGAQNAPHQIGATAASVNEKCVKQRVSLPLQQGAVISCMCAAPATFTHQGKDEAAPQQRQTSISRSPEPQRKPNSHAELLLDSAQQTPVAATLLTTATSGSAEETSEDDNYFGILKKLMPTNLSLEARKDWLRHQRDVLKEAVRVQRYNKQAREALVAYQKTAMNAIGL